MTRRARPGAMSATFGTDGQSRVFSRMSSVH